MDLKLNLFENAIDSLNEALQKYEEAKDGNKNAYKFCVQHLSHFLELLLKFQVSRAHELLLFGKPFQKITKESSTINMWEAIQFLENDGKKISTQFKTDLKWLKSLRNKIEHFEFEMKIEEVDSIIGRLLHAALLFGEQHKLDLENRLDKGFLDLAKGYEEGFSAALKRIAEKREQAFRNLRPDEMQGVNFGPYWCNDCGHRTLIASESSYRCEFCGGEEGDEMIVTCDCCGGEGEFGEMSGWEPDIGPVEMRCPMCSGAYAMSRDNS